MVLVMEGLLVKIVDQQECVSESTGKYDRLIFFA